MIWRSIFRILSPRGGAGRVSILIFHRVLPVTDDLLPDVPDARLFETRMRMLRDSCNVLHLSEALDRISAGSLPERAAVVTFDDGYADNHEVALPILRSLGVPATFFIASGFLDGGIMFNDQVIEAMRNASKSEIDAAWLGLGTLPIAGAEAKRAAIDRILGAVKYLSFDERRDAVVRLVDAAGAKLPDDLMMTRTMVRAMELGGMQIGGHTRNHPILARMEPAAARAEIEGGKADLEQILGHPIDLFAYPNGKPGRDYTREHVIMAREAGYRSAVSTAFGSVGAGADLYQLPRYTPWASSNWRYQAQFAANLLRTPELAAANASAAGH
ncbi:MAG: polysaccharide deacetylase family protein [Rhodocyclaceae bacterium]|nr:polysaccharide deacetylase family protein [Rhodocyclaceae bacterium]MBX3667634.1 polysaccharide deacetylase family protein [Rhodocyclaceae bacterium]